MNTKFLGLLAIFILSIFIFSCKRNVTTPPNPNEEELITTFQFILKDSLGILPTQVVTYKDIDGDGGAAPSVWDTIQLQSNRTYLAEIVLLNESANPVDTISNEVKKEANEHIFCLEASPANIEITRTDKDGNNLELGLKSIWRSKNISQGTLQVILKHQPGSKNGTCTPGASDIDITFQYKIVP